MWDRMAAMYWQTSTFVPEALVVKISSQVHKWVAQDQIGYLGQYVEKAGFVKVQ